MVFDEVPGEVKRLSIAFSLSFLGSSMVWMFLPVFFEQHIENVFLVGVLTSVPAFTTLFMDIPVGNLLQRADSKLFTFIGLILFSIPGIFYITTLTVMMFVGKFVEGISKTLRWESGWYIAMEDSNIENESETLGVFTLGKNISDIIGPVIGGILAFYIGISFNLVLWFFLGVLSFIYFYMYVGFSTDNYKKAFKSLIKKKTYSDDIKHLRENWSSMRWAISLIFIFSIVSSFFWVAVPLILNDLGADYIVMGGLFGLVAIPRVFEVYFGKLADRYGWLRTVQFFSFCVIPVLFIISFMENIVVVGGLILLAMFFSTALNPSLHSYFDKSVSDEVEGEMVGFLELFKHSGQTLGPIIAGAVASRWSISTSFLAAGIISVLFFILVTYIRVFVE